MPNAISSLAIFSQTLHGKDGQTMLLQVRGIQNQLSHVYDRIKPLIMHGMDKQNQIYIKYDTGAWTPNLSLSASDGGKWVGKV